MTTDDEEARWLAEQTASRSREIQAGHLAWTEIDLIDIGDDTARPLRDGLEVFGVRVNYLPVGQPRHLVAALGGNRPVAPYVIIAGHGGDGRILMDEVPDALAGAQPFNGSIGPGVVRGHLRLPGSVVLATGCGTGRPDLADAFLDIGARAFIAPSGYPEGYAGVFAPLFLFYELTERRSLTDAVCRLSRHDDALAMWQLHQR
ncbi:hypothetical protein ACFYYR_25670 [Streptomyces sp. NPDC001922]|uniref:hypothetical protein n=1 Tax=Streptomyces sp. NPDC001922 TaxID=3364624 RepID=UPI003685BB61